MRVRAAGYANEHGFFYLAKKDLQTPTEQFAVLDPKGDITPFLKTRGLHFREFTGAGKSAGNRDHRYIGQRREAQRFTHVEGLCQTRWGGSILEDSWHPGNPKNAKNELVSTGVFPFQTRLRLARGNWDPVNHGIRPHPIFEGLPVKDFMGQPYLNVCANETIEGIQEPPIVGSLEL